MIPIIIPLSLHNSSKPRASGDDPETEAAMLLIVV